MKRIASFDLIRALAIFGIVLSHLFLTGEGSFVHAMGKWLGATFTAVFLGLSALILGSSWIGKGRPVYGGRFFFHRVSRLAVPYWLFLTAFLLVAYGMGQAFPWKDVVMNYVFLGWLAKIPGIGHLWFVTMVVICYAACMAVSRLFAVRWGRKVFPWALAVGCGVLYAVLFRYGFPAYMALILFYYCLLFAYADRILGWLQRHGRTMVLWGVPILLAMTAGLFLSGILTSGKENWIVCGCSLCGIAILLLLQTLFAGIADCPRALSAISGISYEWYLVHHPMVIGPVALVHFLHPWPFAVLCYWVLSLACAFLLHFLSSLVYKLTRA